MSEPNDPDATIVVDRQGGGLPQIPGYTLVKKLGEGGMAQVFLATDDSLRREVAIKLMSASLNSDPGFAERFALEGQIVAQFQHPHIAQVFSAGASGEQLYLVMAYVPGKSLADRLAEGLGSVASVIDTCRQLAGALHYAHHREVIHRDLKPANILFTNDGEPVLCDFGIAKANNFADTNMTATGMVIGSPRYMAPEQLRGEPITEKVDVYALGLVMYEMLTGQALPNKRRLANERDEAKVIARDLPRKARDMAPLIARCLSQDPDTRPTAQACRDELAELSAPPDRRWAVYAGVVLVAALVGAGGMQFLGTQDVPSPPPVEVQPNMAEYDSFHQAMKTVGEAHPGNVHYEPYKTVLELRDLQVQSPADFTRRMDGFKQAAEQGDPRAALVVFLAVDSQLTSHPAQELVRWMSAAADGGLPMASYYQALTYLKETRQANEQRDGDEALDRNQFLIYKSLLEQARRQGVMLGDEALRQIDQILSAEPAPP